jgi:CheY-like chemotaxis protein
MADNGEQALDFVFSHQEKNETIDILLIDVLMPVMSGFEFVKKLEMQKIKIPTLVMTGYAQEDTLKDLKTSGYSIISKPFSFNDLLKNIESLLP